MSKRAPKVTDNQPPQTVVCSRRVLEMVAILHEKGLGNLRIQPAMSPSGAFWRVRLGSSFWFRSDFGATLLPEYRRQSPLYSSCMEAEYFQWTDAKDDTTEQLADRFVKRCPEVVLSASGHDNEYARWYRNMLDMTAPFGLPYAWADWGIADDGLHTICAPGDVVVPFPPLPPTVSQAEEQ